MEDKVFIPRILRLLSTACECLQVCPVLYKSVSVQKGTNQQGGS